MVGWTSSASIVQGAAVVGRQTAVVDIDVPVDRDVGRRCAQAGDLGGVADLEVERLRRRAVRARFEQQCAAPLPISLSTCWAAIVFTVAWIALTGMLGSNTLTL